MFHVMRVKLCPVSLETIKGGKTTKAGRAGIVEQGKGRADRKQEMTLGLKHKIASENGKARVVSRLVVESKVMISAKTED